MQITGKDSGGAITNENQIIYNKIYDNKQYGVYIHSSDGSSCSYNNISDNTPYSIIPPSTNPIIALTYTATFFNNDNSSQLEFPNKYRLKPPGLLNQS